MKSASLSISTPTPLAAAAQAELIELAAQLRSYLFTLRERLSEQEDQSTVLSDSFRETLTLVRRVDGLVTALTATNDDHSNKDNRHHSESRTEAVGQSSGEGDLQSWSVTRGHSR